MPIDKIRSTASDNIINLSFYLSISFFKIKWKNEITAKTDRDTWGPVSLSLIEAFFPFLLSPERNAHCLLHCPLYLLKQIHAFCCTALTVSRCTMGQNPVCFLVNGIPKSCICARITCFSVETKVF